VDALTAEVIRAFQEAGVESRLLKGAAVANWLYSPDDPRPYIDSDLLVRPVDVDAARGTLERLGFVPEIDQTAMPDWWREHAVGWLRPGDSAAVDIHRSLPGVAADDQLLWDTLTADTRHIVVGGAEVATLAPPAMALHVSLHAAQHGPDWGGSVTADLERALAQVDDDTWHAAAQLADRVGATPAFATGLRLSADGARLADRLELPKLQPTEVRLRVEGAPPVALGFEQLATAGGLRRRAAIGLRKLFPPRDFLVHWDPRARESGARLLLARIRRPIWVLRSAPEGFRAWRRARRQARD
jgi:Uncharacterised nucleotidyltransferase